MEGATVSTPFVFVTTHRIKPGGLERFTAMHDEYVDFVERHEPRMLGHFTYLSDDGTEVSLVQIHADPESAEHHLQLVAPRLASIGDVVENTAIEVYGEPGPAVRTALAHNLEAGVPVRVTSRTIGGFSRD
jgi:hypothetical protein